MPPSSTTTNRATKMRGRGRYPGTAASSDRLAMLGLRGSRIDLLRYFAIHPDDRVHLRRLEQLFGARSASFQRDLRALVELGAVRRIDGESRRVEYDVIRSWPLWSAIRTLVAELSDPAVLVREALRGVRGVEAAFVYGSQATGRARPDSDVDVFVLGDDIDRRTVLRSFAEVGILTGRQVNAGVYTRMKLADRIGQPDSPARRFLRDVLTGPKTWVAGDSDALLPIAAAAGIALSLPRTA